MNTRLRTFLIIISIYFLIGALMSNGTQVMNASAWDTFASTALTITLWPLMFGFLFVGEFAIVILAMILISLLLWIYQYRLLAAILSLATILTIATLFIPVTISTRTEQSNVILGAPFHFVIQDQTNYDPPLPMKTGLSSPHNSVTTVRWGNFILSFLSLLGGLLIIGYGIRLIFGKRTATPNTTLSSN